MTTIPLGDYVGYCFTEAVRAREITDEYARRVAEQKDGDPGLRDFSTPRFRIAKLELTIPVVVDDARLNQVARFVMDRGEFVAIVLDRAGQARSMAEQELRPSLEPHPIGGRPALESPAGRAAGDLHDRLSDSPDPLHPDDLVRIGWTEVVNATFAESELLREHRESAVLARLRTQSMRRILDLVREHIALHRPAMEHLLISPLTQAVRAVGDPSAVLNVRAELVEEGFYLRHVHDAKTGTTHTVVDFE